MNLRIIRTNYAADPEIRFPKKWILNPFDSLVHADSVGVKFLIKYKMLYVETTH